MSAEDRDKIAAEIAAEAARILAMEVGRQLTDGNGLATQETMGMTLRELVLESRNDIKLIKDVVPTFVTQKQLAVVSSGVAAIIFGLVSIFG